MKVLKYNLFLILLTISLFSSCSDNDKKINFFNGQPKKIDFSEEYLLKGERIDVDTIGIGYVKVFDPYIILGTYNSPIFTQIYTYDNDYKHIGDFFNKGQGPKDFLGFNIIKKEYPYLWIKDYKNKNVSLLNIENGFSDGDFQIEKTYSYKNTIDPFNVFYINDNCLLIKDFEIDKGLHYYKYNPLKEEKIGNDFVMYNYPITYSFMNKILTLADAMHPNGKKIVSITEAFNQIDIINLEDISLNLSVTTNNNIVDYNNIVNTEEELKEYYFDIPYCNENEIFALYHSEQQEQTEVHIINWNGEPIAKLYLDKKIRGFDVDVSQNYLYGIEESTDHLYKFNLEQWIR